MPNRAVVDTNVLVSALLKPGSLPDRVAQAIRHDMLIPVVCAEIVQEYEAVFRRPRLGLPEHDVTELIGLLQTQALWVQITQYPSALELPDPADWPFIATALAADCHVITGNVKHFPKRLGLKVVTVTEWVNGPARKA
jgi:uncharacterized protein